MWILVPLGKIIVAFPKPWIKPIGLDIVLILNLTNDKSEKYFLSRSMCVVAQSIRHVSTLNDVWYIKVWEISMYLFVKKKREKIFIFLL